MQVYYNSKHNFFRTPEIWDVEILMEIHFPSKDKFFSWFDNIKDELKNGAYFAFDVSHEPRKIGHIFYENSYVVKTTFLDWILEYITINNLSKSAIQVWTGDLNCNQNNDSKYHDIIKPKIRFNHLPVFSTDINFLEERELKKKFSVMMGRLEFKPERLKLFNFLENKNILNDCNYCFNTIKTNSDYPVKFLESEEERNNPNYDLPRFGEKYFKESFCHIIMETFFDKENSLGRRFISEKTFRATNSLQPFLLFAIPNSLKDLKELGFKTFDKWWDESYDEIENTDERFDALIKIIDYLSKKSIKELKKMYLEMIPILKHNYENVFKINNIEKYYLPIDGTFNEIGGLEYVYERMCLKKPLDLNDNIPRIYKLRKNKK